MVAMSVFEKLSKAFEENVNHAIIEKASEVSD
jgi:hypothetical protein